MTVQRRSAFLGIRSPRPRIKTVRPGTEKAPVLKDLPKGEPGQGVGSGPRVWSSKVRLDRKGVNTTDCDENHPLLGTRPEPAEAWGTGWEASGPAARPDPEHPGPPAGRAPGGRGGAI